MTEQERKKYFNDLIAAAGTTEIWTAAGYILPGGELLNLANVEVFPDPAVRVYTHRDMMKFFGFDNNEIMLNGGIRVGFGDDTDIPYAQIVLEHYSPSSSQWSRIEEMLLLEPQILDLEMNITLQDTGTSFYKRYTSEDTINDMKRDMAAYLDGDTTNYGSFSERTGVPDATDPVVEEESESEEESTEE